MKALSREGKFIAGCLATAALLIATTALLTPKAVERDQSPTTYNSGERGMKAAFLALPGLGYQTARWERPSSDLATVDAQHTTLVLASPQRDMVANEAAGVSDFVRRGGWVVGTGLTAAQMLLPDPSDLSVNNEECKTIPEGFSAIAHIPHLDFEQSFEWKNVPADLAYAQSCGDRAAVLLISMGKGTVVLWSDSAPMSNAGVKKDENLQLLLASLPASRRLVLFDEYIHNYNDYLWRQAGGTPLRALKWQLALLAAVIVFSFTRRHGPLRELHTTPRTSPLEFAHSMGNVYHRAGAGEAAVDEAQRRFFRFLEDRCGLSRETIQAGPREIRSVLNERFGYNGVSLETLLEPANGRIAAAEAFHDVQGLDRARAGIGQIIHTVHPNTEKDPHA